MSPNLIAERAVVVMGKRPVPGRVKTRLGLPPEAAATLYAAFLRDVFRAVGRALALRPGRAVFAVALEPGETVAVAEGLAPPGWRVVAQEGRDLGERMRHAWRMSQARHAVVMGSDLPTLEPERIVEALDVLERGPSKAEPPRAASPTLRDGRSAVRSGPPLAVFVPALDGGYVLVGLSRDEPALFSGIPWSTSTVMADTARAAERARVPLVRLAPAADVDAPEDLERLRFEVRPDSHTARALVGLGFVVPSGTGEV